MPDHILARQELAAFLTSRRRQADRSAYQLPDRSRSRTPQVGLRREEVAALSGVSITWYTWLEQAREVSPSRQVLGALARTFMLSDAETGYLYQLAGYSPEPEQINKSADPQLAILQQFLDSQNPSPAFALAANWDVVAWNRGYELLYPAITSGGQNNLLRTIFTDPSVRKLLPDWPTTSRRFLAEFRADHGGRMQDRQVTTLVSQLQEVSAEFAAAWLSHEVARFPSGQREFNHATAGPLSFHQYQLTPTDHPHMRIIVYLTLPGSQTWTQLMALLGQ